VISGNNKYPRSDGHVANQQARLSGNVEQVASAHAWETIDCGARAADLLNQQIWCWGQDINSASGNLLIRTGFQRFERPPGCNAASVYRLDISPTARIVLRGFGVFYGDDRWGGVFVQRGGFSPRLTPDADLAKPAWRYDDLPPLKQPGVNDFSRCQRLLLELIEWIHQYEVAIAVQPGIGYRRETLLPWAPRKNRVVPAEEMAAVWRQLGLNVADHPERWLAERSGGSGRDS